jgi:hypothetical protein
MNALRLSAAGALLTTVAATAGYVIGCGPEQVAWGCLSPITGKSDYNYYDGDHYVNDVFDPCHCYDLRGSLPTCPIVVDAGPNAPP